VVMLRVNTFFRKEVFVRLLDTGQLFFCCNDSLVHRNDGLFNAAYRSANSFMVSNHVRPFFVSQIMLLDKVVNLRVQRPTNVATLELVLSWHRTNVHPNFCVTATRSSLAYDFPTVGSPHPPQSTESAWLWWFWRSRRGHARWPRKWGFQRRR